VPALDRVDLVDVGLNLYFAEPAAAPAAVRQAVSSSEAAVQNGSPIRTESETR